MQDVRALAGEFRPIDIAKADIIRACVETQLAQPLRVERSRTRGLTVAESVLSRNRLTVGCSESEDIDALPCATACCR